MGSTVGELVTLSKEQAMGIDVQGNQGCLGCTNNPNVCELGAKERTLA